jgi:hypothetical protein
VVADCKQAGCDQAASSHIELFLRGLPMDTYAPLVLAESTRTDLVDWQQLVRPLDMYEATSSRLQAFPRTR